MSERERWVVYPLLFLALGAALRDKLFDRTTAKSIVCQELTVVDQEPIAGRSARVLARIGRAESSVANTANGYLFVSGQLEVNGKINANEYAYRGVPFVPASQVLPVFTPGVLRALQQSIQAWQQANPSGGRPPTTSGGEQQQPPAEPAPGQTNPPPERPPGDQNR